MPKIEKLLVANRGEIAVRVIRTAKTLGIKTVAVYHALDKDTLAVREADESWELFGETPVAAYMDVDGIVEGCRKTGSNAIHPGYGFLSENAGFAQSLSEAGIIFIGPQPELITLMGDKVISREFIVRNGFPVAPSEVEEDDPATFLERARAIGTPLLIKAAAGGGGKGMRIVRDLDELSSQIEQAKSEGLRYFGDDRIYCEKYIDNPRHIEVQVMGDQHGNVVHFWERECSIQRRFQKIIEETPSPALDQAQREKICTTAVNIAKAANYTNAGTVEFIMAPDGGFYFLEMNTRLQVEHPVTEAVTGFDLVAEQIKVAEGHAFEFSQQDIPQLGHAFELRIYAEDPDQNYMPSIGKIQQLIPPTGPGIRFDCGLDQGLEVTPAFDPMIAKVIIHGQNRKLAIQRSIQALKDMVLMGFTTNAAFLGRVLANEKFAAGDFHTHFLDDQSEALAAPELEIELQQLLIAAATLTDKHNHASVDQIPEPYASIGGWRN